MARVDYEQAWVELGELIASRDGWGSKALTLEMAKLAASHRISETFLERALRIYGGQVTLVVDSPEASSSDPGGTPIGLATIPGHQQSEGGRDGSSRNAEPANVGC